MAVSLGTLALGSEYTVVSDADADATAERNIGDGAAVVYLITIDNALNAAEAEFLCLYDAQNPTVGTTAPDFVFRVSGGQLREFYCPEGFEFDTAVSMACKTAGGTAGTTNPTANVLVTITLL